MSSSNDSPMANGLIAVVLIGAFTQKCEEWASKPEPPPVKVVREPIFTEEVIDQMVMGATLGITLAIIYFLYRAFPMLKTIQVYLTVGYGVLQGKLSETQKEVEGYRDEVQSRVREMREYSNSMDKITQRLDAHRELICELRDFTKLEEHQKVMDISNATKAKAKKEAQNEESDYNG